MIFDRITCIFHTKNQLFTRNEKMTVRYSIQNQIKNMKYYIYPRFLLQICCIIKYN